MGRKKNWTEIQSFQIESFSDNFIFIDAGYESKSGLNEMNDAGAVNEAHGEDLAFKPLCLPIHSAGSIHLEDLDFGHKLNNGVCFLPR